MNKTSVYASDGTRLFGCRNPNYAEAFARGYSHHAPCRTSGPRGTKQFAAGKEALALEFAEEKADE